jgi:hypothetical protein
MNLAGQTVTVVANLFGRRNLSVTIKATVKPYRADGSLVRVAIGDEPGRVEHAGIVGSCIHQGKAYRWQSR